MIYIHMYKQDKQQTALSIDMSHVETNCFSLDFQKRGLTYSYLDQVPHFTQKSDKPASGL